MMKERSKVLVAVWLVLEKDGQILLIRRYNTGYMDGQYTLVSGHVEADEGSTAAMIREAKEEAGISLSREDLSVCHINHRWCPDREYIDIFFLATRWAGTPQNMEPAKCDDLQWFSVDNLPSNVLGNVKSALDAVTASQFYGEYGWSKESLK